MGLRLSELDQLTIGQVLDMLTERGNDEFQYMELATQEDFDRF